MEKETKRTSKELFFIYTAVNSEVERLRKEREEIEEKLSRLEKEREETLISYGLALLEEGKEKEEKEKELTGKELIKRELNKAIEKIEEKISLLKEKGIPEEEEKNYKGVFSKEERLRNRLSRLYADRDELVYNLTDPNFRF